MARLLPGDELELTVCDWCSVGVSESELVETNDGSRICPDCSKHYDSNIPPIVDDLEDLDDDEF